MIRDWLFGIAAALAFAGIARILFLLLFRRPAAARVTSIGLTESERLYERDMHVAALFDGKPSVEDVHYWPTSARVAYEVDGVEHRSDVCLIRHAGDRPEMTPVIWYDPRIPDRATGLGLGPAMLLLLAAGGVAVMGWNCPF